MKYTAKFREHPFTRRQAPSTLPWTLTRCLPPVAPDQTGWRPCLVHRSGSSDTSWSSLSNLCVGVPVLDAPVPQMVDKLDDVLRIVDLPVPVQDIEVPQISSLCRPPLRRALPLPQTAEQLVDVPSPAWMRLALGTDAAGRVWTCVWRAPATPSAPARRGSPPAKGGI